MLHVFILYTKCIEIESYRRSVRSRSEIPPLRDYCGMMWGSSGEHSWWLVVVKWVAATRPRRRLITTLPESDIPWQGDVSSNQRSLSNTKKAFGLMS